MATVVDVTEAAPIRIVIVDDDPMVRTGLSMILGGDPALSIVGEAADGEEALSLVQRVETDVVLMDIRMPVRDGLSATAELLRREDPPRVIVLTTFDTDDMVLRALRIGASGFLLKDTPPARLVEAVRSVAAGDPMLSPQITAQLIAAVRDVDDAPDDGRSEARERLASLTERELEVARAVGRGLSNAEIAAELYMSVATVKAHVGRVLTKLGADNRVQVALLVHDAG
ncbi:Regulatory protein, LuxR:Response regulator receiver [Nostocoides japonicum T1-X7]|uniref:Regulatory protein, LuxR:Response regulator receiver n=1 Tax=Nostocoides japonicum T1-X7 TaxID=1194083 RepID=A0A077LT72_9MICO|nr:response regulator transcription factor [Tetrasphaera japonica]CCH76236.1 Regulatory protein, LuxR:Response regulator receiver [Tetrasphaera japonica T1-X7]